jgi:hypothetical protein
MDHFVNDTIPSPPPVETIPPDTLIPEVEDSENVSDVGLSAK